MSDGFLNAVGPLGHPTEIENYGTVVVVGGGVGIAPLFPITRALKQAGNKVISVIGARNQSLLFWEERMRAVSDELIVWIVGHGPDHVPGEDARRRQAEKDVSAHDRLGQRPGVGLVGVTRLVLLESRPGRPG